MLDLARHDTICAPATANAPAALALIRWSGTRAREIRDAIFRPRHGAPRDFVAHLGDVVDEHGELLDEALCVTFPHGKSFTGEDTVELTLHGGPTRVRSTLRTLQAHGARLASPGEFTLRAMLSGRLDLSAAEAVADVIAARSDAAARVALRNLHGGLGQAVEPARAAIIDVLAEIEARLDFPDEDLGAPDALVERIERGEACLRRLLDGAALGERMIEGARIVLYGAPNAGKSTLLNTLCGEERALVHETPGTTRDVLESPAVFGGVPCTLVDVAGVRDDADSPVEQLGIARARNERARADLTLHVIDGTDLAPEAVEGVVVFTKFDLAPSERPLHVSAHTGHGIEALRATIAAQLGAHDAGDALLTRARQREEVAAAVDAMRVGRAALTNGEVHEIVASELRGAGAALDRLLGKDLREEVLDAVFSRFCIGK